LFETSTRVDDVEGKQRPKSFSIRRPGSADTNHVGQVRAGRGEVDTRAGDPVSQFLDGVPQQPLVAGGVDVYVDDGVAVVVGE
jgi:hypothetical protein